LLGRHHVRHDACVSSLRGIEEELDDRVPDKDLRVVVGGHQDKKSGEREQGARHHDRPAPPEPSIQTVGPGADQRGHGHRQQAAHAKGEADGRVLRSLGHDLVDLGLDQDRRQRKPEEVAAEPEGAESSVLEVPVVGGRGSGGSGRGHGERLS
jgi:hypothetical protein